jgi:hypothetical protein
MRSTLALRPALFAAIFFVLCPVVYSQDATPELDGLSWMAGCWEQQNDARKMVISEQWMAPAGDSMIGMSRTVRDGKTTGYEFLRIVERADGIFYIARPSQNKDETEFRLTGASAKRAEFVNPEHDFPQRIVYTLTETGDLHVRVEATRDGKTRGFDLRMMRTNCSSV